MAADRFLPKDFNQQTKDEIIRKVKAEVDEKGFSRIDKHAIKIFNLVMPNAATSFSVLKEIAFAISSDRKYVAVEINEKDFEIRSSGKNYFERNNILWDIAKIGGGLISGLVLFYLTHKC